MYYVDLGESFRISSYYLLATVGFDTAENELCKVWPLSAYRFPRWFGGGLQAGMRHMGFDLHYRVLVELGFILVGVCMLFLGSWMEAGWIFLTGVALTAIGTATLVVGLFYDLCYGFGPTKHESNVSNTALIAKAMSVFAMSAVIAFVIAKRQG